jgi:toxin FitB
MYLLDTCIISEAWRRTPQAVMWLQAAQSETLFLSVITVGEIMKGMMMKLRTDPPAAVSLLRWLHEPRLVYAARSCR